MKIVKKALPLFLASILLLTGIPAVSAAQAKSTPKSLKLLMIGNSFSDNTAKYFYRIAKDAGVEEVTVAYLFIGGCSLATHWNNASQNLKAYEYFKDNSGIRVKQTGLYSIEDGLLDEDWDVVTLQQASAQSGVSGSYNTDLTNLIDYVKQKKPNARLWWLMTWAYSSEYTANFPQYGRDQAKMYEMIAETVKSKIDTNNNFEGIAPLGTAVQNMKTSFTKEDLYLDGTHLGSNGCYLAGLTLAKALGLSLEQLTYLPPGGKVTAENLAAYREAAENAVAKPFEVTKSSYPDGMGTPPAASSQPQGASSGAGSASAPQSNMTASSTSSPSTAAGHGGALLALACTGLAAAAGALCFFLMKRKKAGR